MGGVFASVLSRGPLGFARRGVQGLSYWHRARTFRPYVVRKTIAGEDFTFHIGDLEAKDMYDHPRPWRELSFMAEHVLRPGDLVADCGANHGITGCFFARRVGETGRVLGFEPNRVNAEAARSNARLNRAANFEIRETVLGATTGTAFFRPEMNGSVTNAEDARAVAVPQVTLDDAFAARAPDVVKIDVEGHELDVLRGARRVLSTLPRFDLEIHVCTFSDPRGALRELTRLVPVSAYELHVQRTVNGSIARVVLDEGTLDSLAQLENVHLFGVPRTPGTSV